MDERRLSLTDVMLGIERLSLHNILTPANFRFFWGLIMIGNRLNPRFKNPFDVTVNQAIGAGGGESRQGVNRRQHALKKIRIDGQWLIKIKAGSKVNNRAALYEINYGLIVPLNLAAPVFERQPSQKQDGYDDGHDDGYDDGLDDANRSILRSEERRREKTSSYTNYNVVSKQEQETCQTSGGGDVDSDSDKEKARARSKEVEELQDLIIETFHPQITAKPPYAACRSAIDKHGFDMMKEAAAQVAGRTLKSPTPSGALNYVVGTARNNNGIDYAQRNKIAMALQDLKADLSAGEAETDLSKFENVHVPSGEGLKLVDTKEEWMKCVREGISRLKGLLR